MEFMTCGEELSAMGGLPHIQQLAYLRGIRPYMDTKTGITGIKRRISYQSISEQLYIEPHQGIKSQDFSRDQVRRAVLGLARAGIIEIQSEGKQLILKCPLATRDFSVQNKAAINPPQKAATNPHVENLLNAGLFEGETIKPDTGNTSKAATPLIKENYLYFLSGQFEKFWSLYPEKKSREQAWDVFQQLHPDEGLCREILKALSAQIKSRNEKKACGEWVPPWKYPANWLAKRSWEDEITMEIQHAKRAKNTRSQPGEDMFWCEEIAEEPKLSSNVIQFKREG